MQPLAHAAGMPPPSLAFASQGAAYFDREAVTLLAERMKAVAGDVDGDFVLVTMTDEAKKQVGAYCVSNSRNAVEEIVQKAELITAEHLNVYFAGALFKRGSVDSWGNGRSEANVIGMLCGVADFDQKNDPATRHERLPFAPTAEVETSPGNFQSIYWFDRLYSVAEAKPVLETLVRTVKADKCYSCDHVWRVPGTWNWPDPKKQREGRTIQPSRWSLEPEARRVTVEDLKANLPPADASPPSRGDTKGPFDWDQRTREREPVDDAELVKALSKDRGDRSEIAFEVIRRLIDNGYSPTEIVTALWTFHALPVMGHYRDERHLQEDVQRAFEKSIRTSEDGKRLPVIYLKGGQLPANVDACEAALIAANVGVYQRTTWAVEVGKVIVDVREGKKQEDLLITRLSTPRLVELFTSVAVLKNHAQKSWTSVNCPRPVAETYLSRVGKWNLPALQGVINAPTLLLDGTLLDRPGYDTNTGLYYDPRGAEFPSIPDAPTKEDALAALATLDELIGKFPFASDADWSVARAALLTSVVRRVLPAAPLLAFDGTAPGTGKSKLADSVSIVASGRRATTMSYGESEAEFEKRLASLFMRGDLVINIDNLECPLKGACLNGVLTQNPYSFRTLGKSEMPTVPTNSLLIATGNSIRLEGDVWRRVLTCLIDPGMERPSERKFEFDPVQRASEHRGRYVAACLTVLRAYQVAGCPAQNGRHIGSFEEWSHVVRDALLWLGCADPVQQCEPQDDPVREQFSALVTGWKAILGDGHEPLTLRTVIERAQNSKADRSLYEAVIAITGPLLDVSGVKKLGDYIRKKNRQVIHGHRIVSTKDKDRRGSALWKLEKVSEAKATK